MVEIPAGAKDVSSLQHPDWLWDSLSLLHKMSNVASFPGDKVAEV
jgi:hypothetical protein